jgi:hypothetical protein
MTARIESLDAEVNDRREREREMSEKARISMSREAELEAEVEALKDANAKLDAEAALNLAQARKDAFKEGERRTLAREAKPEVR